MLELLQSNNMSALVNSFCHRNASQAKNPFEATTVVVQSFGIGQWLKLQVAEQTGIAANIDCILPAELIWRLYQAFLPQSQLPDESPFARHLLTWRLMQLLPTCTEPEFSAVQQYLNGPDDDQLRLYQLSNTIAGLFDQYLIYRPDWITQWQSGSSQSSALEALGADAQWQGSLWQKIIELPGMDPQQHRASLHESFMHSLQSQTAPTGHAESQSDLGSTISVFGLSSLPQMHLQTLQAISTIIDVDIYFLNPCEHYWGDIVSEKDVAKRSIRQIIQAQGPLLEEDYLEVGNPLLSSFGKQGREFLEMLLETDNLAVQEHFAPIDGNNTLINIKNDILALEFGGVFYDSQDSGLQQSTQKKHPADRSVEIHSCHSRMREVEILFDQIMAMIDQNTGINPADIIVMAPDISKYAPFIEAVFRNKLYFTITDRPVNQESAVLVAFEKLLNLPQSRLTSTEVMDFLEVPTIRAKFNLDEADIATIIYWVKKTGIRWEADGSAKQSNWDLPASDHNTWHFGIRRLLLGMAMQAPGEYSSHPETGTHSIYQTILPFEVNPGDSRLLGTFCQFIDLLTDYRSKLTQAQSAENWHQTVNNLIDDFFLATENDEFALNNVREALTRLNDQTSICSYQQPISHSLLTYWLTEQLSSDTESRGFISGGITFATLVPMRSIPFRAVCLIGMNDGEFPREDRPLGFDLMAKDYRRGDRSRRNDDRYLFLEAMLSATDFFYISYEGRSLKDNKQKPPSVLVSELDDYLQRIYQVSYVTEHPLQPFSDKYFDPQFPQLISYQQDWYQALKSQQSDIQFQDIELLDDEEFTLSQLDQLTQFFRHPAKYYLRKLGVYFDQNDVELLDTESFQLDGLERYQLADAALNVLVHQRSIEAWQEQMYADGQLMEGIIGRQHLQRELARATAVYEKLTEGITSSPQSVGGKIKIGDINLTGEVTCFGEQQIDYRTGTLRKRQLLEVWLKHLFLNACGYEGESYLISTISKNKQENAVQSFLKPVEQNEAKVLLSQLADLYNQGIRKPLAFLPETSFAFYKNLDQENDVHQAKEKALQYYHQETAGTEGLDYSYNRLFSFPNDFTDDFSRIAKTIYEPLMQHWQEED